MKKIITLLALVALAVPFAAQAGINPATAGLPNVVFSAGADNNLYNITATVQGNRASVMCVACHTRNPAARTPYRVNNGYLLTGSHWVTSNFADTSKGGGYTDGSSPHDRATRIAAGTAFYFADGDSANATIANGWYGRPKYGVTGPDNTFSNTAGTQMICESCHSIVRNIGIAKLLATGFANGGTTTSSLLVGAPGTTTPVLCIGCHSDMDGGVNAEWQLHPLVSGTWGGTHHHRNTPGSAVYLGAGTGVGDSGMNNMTATDYNANISGGIYQLWAAGPGQLTGTRALSWSANPQRVRNVAGTDNNQIGARGTNLMCTNCHRAHNADSTAGATILMRGDMTTTTAIGSGVAVADQATGWRGTTRMQDRGGRGAAFTNTNPLCVTCHL